MKHVIKIGSIILILASAIWLDHVTKAWAVDNLKDTGIYQEYLEGFINITYAENTGAFLGMGGNLPSPFREILLHYFPAIILAGLVAYLFYPNKQTFFDNIALAMIAGGGLSNIIDRFLFEGVVTDFIVMKIPFIRIQFTGVINIADIFVTFGFFMILFSSYFLKKKKNQPETKTESKS